MRDEHPNLLTRLIDWRNLTQVLVSMDPRYGPIYNAGGARSLYAALVNHGYVAASGAPVVLIGYSGGAQVCLGAATYLKPALDAPLTVVSLGGAVGSDRGLESSTTCTTSMDQATSSRSCRPSSCPRGGRWPGARAGTAPSPTAGCSTSPWAT